MGLPTLQLADEISVHLLRYWSRVESRGAHQFYRLTPAMSLSSPQNLLTNTNSLHKKLSFYEAFISLIAWNILEGVFVSLCGYFYVVHFTHGLWLEIRC